ncbi:hypothetical protein D9611_010009 [Ephemerocybe angulata]|uniref:Uncharacterized protein n=1 Tax=Ephemerocybe angulata TaxID=980116 RepID=A0A8H5C6B2_9AGAR|nr:hypothetical protein D9611_010009 [Tulosesus angulatus]
MSDESFPNAEKLLQAAYAQSNPAPELLRLLKANPTYPAVVDLLVQYTEAAEEKPSRAEALAGALVRVRDASDAPVIADNTLTHYFSRQLADLHTRGLDGDDDDFSASNTYLINSLLSGLSFKYGLTSSPDQYGAIQSGLDVKTRTPLSQVLLIGAVIQLLVAGSIIVPQGTSYWSGAEEIATKLKAQKQNGVIRDKDVGAVLDLAIAHAESGFKTENDVSNVWDTVFPPSS